MSDLLSEAELSDMQAEAEENMPETVYVQAEVLTSNGAGGTSSAISTVATTTGKICPLGNSAQEREIAGRLGNVQLLIVKLPVGTVVDPTHQLQISGTQYQVHGVLGKSHQTVMRVVCSVVK